MKIRFILPLLLFSFSVLHLSAAESRPVLLLGHGSDTWKVGKVLSNGNIASKTVRDWPPAGSFRNHAAVYIGESVQGIALNAWNDKDFREVEKYVADGGVLIFSGDTAFQLTGKNISTRLSQRSFMRPPRVSSSCGPSVPHPDGSFVFGSFLVSFSMSAPFACSCRQLDMIPKGRTFANPPACDVGPPEPCPPTRRTPRFTNLVNCPFPSNP